MAASYFATKVSSNIVQDDLSLSSPTTPVTSGSKGPSALASKITAVLSSSYSDLDIRDALEVLDSREFRNTADSRRHLRLDVQKEVIQCNGEIVTDFGQVAEVGTSSYGARHSFLMKVTAAEAHRKCHCEAEQKLY